MRSQPQKENPSDLKTNSRTRSGQGQLKVTTQIQSDEIRVTGKSRDELQSVIAAVRAKEFPVAVQFVNFRE